MNIILETEIAIKQLIKQYEELIVKIEKSPKMATHGRRQGECTLCALDAKIRMHYNKGYRTCICCPWTIIQGCSCECSMTSFRHIDIPTAKKNINRLRSWLPNVSKMHGCVAELVDAQD